jgi:hypothetical protein
MDMKQFYNYCNQAIDGAAYIEMSWAHLWTDGDKMIGEFEESRQCTERWHGCEIYTIHDSVGALVYTGKSRGRVRQRLLDHRGFGDKTGDGKPTSTVGKYLAENKDSRNWKVRIYDLPHSLEQQIIFRHNGYLNDDYKPRKPSVSPTPTPSQQIIDEANTKRQQKMNSTLKF